MRIGPKESITNLLLSFYLIWMVTVTANSQTLPLSDVHGEKKFVIEAPSSKLRTESSHTGLVTSVLQRRHFIRPRTK